MPCAVAVAGVDVAGVDVDVAGVDVAGVDVDVAGVVVDVDDETEDADAAWSEAYLMGSGIFHDIEGEAYSSYNYNYCNSLLTDY